MCSCDRMRFLSFNSIYQSVCPKKWRSFHVERESGERKRAKHRMRERERGTSKKIVSAHLAVFGGVLKPKPPSHLASFHFILLPFTSIKFVSLLASLFVCRFIRAERRYINKKRLRNVFNNTHPFIKKSIQLITYACLS